jgi:hypothetical protein
MMQAEMTTRMMGVVRLLSCICVLLNTFAESSIAGLIFNFSGTVTSIDNPAGTNVWGAQSVVGSNVVGSFSYDPLATPTSSDATFGQWILPVTPGGSNGMSLTGASFGLAARNTMIIDVYRDASIPAFGTVFQFDDSSANGLSLPQNATVRNAGFLLDFISSNANLSTLPNLPTNFLPLSQWNNDNFAFVDFRIGAGATQTASLNFRIDTITAVPEPNSLALVSILVLCLVPILRRFRRRDL